MASDWGPALQQGAKAAAAVLVAVYTAGLVAGSRWRQLLQQLTALQLALEARLGLPGGNSSVALTSPPAADLFVGPPKMVIQRQAPVAPAVLTRRAACRRLRAQGLSPAKIGRELGISRSTVRRELAA